ncbi:MAG: DUF4179 domain-containing protein [Eubacteriales bacterium]|nr:DUF4179 domain-containing protein [Eubacteriales bacterium]
MKKQIEFPELENTRLDDKIRRIMQREFPLPEKAEAAKNEAFAQIKDRCKASIDTEAGQIQGRDRCRNKANTNTRHTKRKQKAFFRAFAGTAAAAAVFSAVCITNPAFAAQIPLVGHVFEEIGQSLGFSGDFSKYAKPLKETASGGENQAEGTEQAGGNETVKAVETAADTDGAQDTNTEDTGSGLYSMSHNGMTVTLSEVYCNDVALYVSMVITSEEEFPDTMLWDDETGTVILDLFNSTLKFSYNDNEILANEDVDGKMVDEHTYAGVLRCDLTSTTDSSDYESYYKKRDEFLLEKGITQDELDNMTKEVSAKICELLGIEDLTDEAIALAGGPDIKDYMAEVEIPDSFSVELNIPQIVGTKANPETMPEMPEDLLAEYEKEMEEHGLGLTDEDYAGFTEEEAEIEHQLYIKMWNAYTERYPGAYGYPNDYQNWSVDGPWSFRFDVSKNTSETIVKQINDVDENGLGLVSVTKTPFEITIDDGGGYDYFTVALDANGDILPYGGVSGSANVLAVQDRDVSKIDIYICDYIEYMDELKGYYWSDDYEENKKTKTFKQLLDERALYHKEVTFED